MRAEVCRLAAIVAWPALAWCTLEAALRAALGDAPGAFGAAAMAAAAAGMVVAAETRRRQLRGAASGPPR